MKRQGIMLICILLLAVLLCLPTAAAENVILRDFEQMLSESEKSALSVQLAALSSKSECALAVMTRADASFDFAGDSYSRTAYMEKVGNAFLREEGLNRQTDLILLIVTKGRGGYYYDMFLYGEAYDNINQKEIDYILDHDDVYDNLKGGRIYDGVTAFASLAAKGYTGRVGASYAVIASVSFCIALAVAIGACVGVKVSYGMKKKSIDYPLDRFAKLNLTERSDVFTGSFVTKRVIQTGNGGSAGRGGGSRGGHAGGR